MSTQFGFWNWFLRRAGQPGSNRVSPGAPDWSPTSAAAEKLSESYAHVTPLIAAVEAFNRRAELDAIGRSQPLLTVDEVTTAIRSAGRHQLPLVESQRRQIQSIAERQQLPAGGELKFTTSWLAPSGYRCEVWWIDLVLLVPNQGGESHPASSCSLRIRDHRLRSWHDPSVTVPSEIQHLNADHRWFPPGPARTEVSTHP